MTEGLFNGGLFIGRALLPFAARVRVGDAQTAEFLAVGNPIALPHETVVACHPLLNLMMVAAWRCA